MTFKNDNLHLIETLCHKCGIHQKQLAQNIGQPQWVIDAVIQGKVSNDTTIANIIGRLLRRLRELKGYSFNDLAPFLNSEQLQKLEKGDVKKIDSNLVEDYIQWLDNFINHTTYGNSNINRITKQTQFNTFFIQKQQNETSSKPKKLNVSNRDKNAMGKDTLRKNHCKSRNRQELREKRALKKDELGKWARILLLELEEELLKLSIERDFFEKFVWLCTPEELEGCKNSNNVHATFINLVEKKRNYYIKQKQLKKEKDIQKEKEKQREYQKRLLVPPTRKTTHKSKTKTISDPCEGQRTRKEWGSAYRPARIGRN